MKFSIITIVKDNAVGLQRTLNSLFTQKYLNWQSIIVVGASSDESLSVAKSFGQRANVLVLEQKGLGIYEAMNQGLLFASGDYTVFMNSGDIFYDDYVLESVHQAYHKKANYGLYVGGYSFKSKIDAKQINYCLDFDEISPLRFSFKRRVCHQSMYFHTVTLREEVSYSLNYRLCSDFDAALRISKMMGVQGISRSLAIIERGGIAESNIVQVVMEKYRIRQVHFPEVISRSINIAYTLALLIKVIFFKSRK